MKIKIITFLIVGTSITFSVNAQSVVGFWGVTEVTVGNRKMTPVAKWFKFSEDGNSTGGNGWTQNSIGTWSYDEKTQELVPTNDLGIIDEFGPFKVHFVSDTMKWTRQEEGMKVMVSLVPIQEMPSAPADLIKGLWTLSKTESPGGNELKDFDPNDKQFIFIRPDMRFRLRYPDDSFCQGFWHMDGHRPIMTLINYDRSIDNQEFAISFENDQLIMKSNNEAGNVYYYKRERKFPE
jgi:hypothetical protein